MPGDPQRRLGDRLTIDDPAIMTDERDVFVTSINWRLGSSGFSQSLEAVDAADLYIYGDTDPGYFVVGVSVLEGTGNSDHVFY